MRRARRLVAAFARGAGVAGLAVAAAACGGGTLDAGHNNPPDAAPTGLLDNLVGHWRLDDGTGSTTAFDSSARGNNGVLHGLDASTAWVNGRALGALDIAHAGWVQVAPSPSIDAIADRITISAWVNQQGPISSMDKFGTALSRQIGTSMDQHYHLSLLKGRPNLFITTDIDWVQREADNAVTQNSWVHLAGVYDGAMVRLYVDGAEVASAPLTGRFMADTTPVILGGNGNDATGVPTELLPGRIDELMLYARALSADEIRQLASGAAFPGGPRDAGAD